MIEWNVGDTVLAPVPEMNGLEVKRPKFENLRRCEVERGPGRDGRMLLKVKWSKQDELGRPHRIFAAPDELRVDTSSA